VYDKNIIVNVKPPPLAYPKVARTGNWIYVAANENVYLYRTVPTTTQTSTITVKSGGGWAIIGFNSLKTTMKASQIAGMYSPSGSITTIATFDNVNKTYKTYIVGGPPPTDFYLVPGNGYWVYIKLNGTLTYSP
jgi:hypothetical protein